MKTLLSLFDYSGRWSEPFARGGWNVIQWDIKIDEFMDVNNIGSVGEALELFEDIDGILIAPPCTDFTVACNRLWNMKDLDGRTAAASRLVEQSLKLVDLFTPTDPDYDGVFFWALENPVGRIDKLFPELGDPYYFNPCEFAGYLNHSKKVLSRLNTIRKKNGVSVTRLESAYVLECEAYNKRTGLWGSFNHDLVKKPIAPVRCCAQGSPLQRLGKNTAETKESRSNTPLGFAQAFFNANDNWTGWREDPINAHLY